MRIQIFSDLHTDVAQVTDIAVGEVDAVVVAGDVCQGIRNAFVGLRRIVPERIPIIMTAGNHEFYRRSWPDEIDTARRAAPGFNIVFLENDVVLMGTTRIVGATLWTNFRVFGDINQAAALETARRGMTDFRTITWQKDPWQRFRPQEAMLLHERSRSFIADVLATSFRGSTVVLTHHAPHFGSVPKGPQQSDLLTAAYVSDLTAILQSGPTAAPMMPDRAVTSVPTSGAAAREAAPGASDRIWVHGHVHCSSDYVVGQTRILANPHGYGPENSSFDPCLVVEVGS